MPKFFKSLWVLSTLYLLSACVPSPTSTLTTGAAVAVAAIDQSEKRNRLLDRAQKGDVYAQYELAESFSTRSIAGERDGAQALHWYCTAGRNGFLRSQIKIAQFYDGTTPWPVSPEPAKSDTLAHAWYALAAQRGNKDARDHKFELEKRMLVSELEAAMRLTRSPRTLPCGHIPPQTYR